MPESLQGKLVVAISSRALFDLSESHRIYLEEGVVKYKDYQIAHEEAVLQPGVAFPLIKRILNLHFPETQDRLTEVILISKNDADTGLRVFNSIEHYGLRITRAVFTRGRSPFKYLAPFKVDLFLSADPEDVRSALLNGHASAMILDRIPLPELEDGDEIRIAFDGDAVLFSDESERVYQSQGLAAFQDNERANATIPLPPGPFKSFLASLHRIQAAYLDQPHQPIRTALVTARNAPAHKRVINTLRHWGISIDEAFFMGGLPKTPVLEQFRPHIFFDDQVGHCESAARVVPTAQVLGGITNQPLFQMPK